MYTQKHRNKSGEIATTLTIASLIVMLAGVFVGRNQAVRENVQKYISSAQTTTVAPTPPPSSKCPKASCQVRLVKNTLKVYQDSSDPKVVHLDGNFCFAGEAVSGTHDGRLWLSKDPGGKNVVGPVRHYTLYPGNTWPGPCDRDGVLQKNKQMNTPSSENSFSITVSLADFGTASCPLIYFNYVSTGGGGETYDDRSFVALSPLEYGACGPIATPRPSNTPTPGATNTPTPAGACSLNLTAYLKERMSDGTLRDMTEIDRKDVKWYAINDQQIARHGSAYNPANATDNWYGFTHGKILANVPNVAWPIKAASDDTSGRPYVYQKGSKASVKLVFDKDQYEIESVDPGPGTVADSATKDTVGNLLLDCGQNYAYGWVMKKKPTNSCPLRTTENAEKCKIKNVRAALQAGSSRKVDVTWDSMTDTACPFDVYHVEIMQPTDGGKIVCSRDNIGKDELSVGCDVRTDRSQNQLNIDNFTPGLIYTANVYLLKNAPPGCFSNPGATDFKRDGGNANDKRSHQLDVWDSNNQNDMCFISADTTGDKNPSGGGHCTTSADISDGKVNSMTVEYKNNTNRQLSMQWQLNSCNGKLLSELSSKECNNFVASNTTQLVSLNTGQTLRCKWDDPKNKNRPTPDNCEVVGSSSGGGNGGGSGGSGGGSGGGTNPTNPPSGGGSNATPVPTGTSCSCQRNSSTNTDGVCSSGCASAIQGTDCTTGSSGDQLCRSGVVPTARLTPHPAATTAPTAVPPIATPVQKKEIKMSFIVKNLSQSEIVYIYPFLCNSNAPASEIAAMITNLYQMRGSKPNVHSQNCTSYENVVQTPIGNTSQIEPAQTQEVSTKIRTEEHLEFFKKVGDQYRLGCTFTKQRFGIVTETYPCHSTAYGSIDTVKSGKVGDETPVTYNLDINRDGVMSSTFAITNQSSDDTISSIIYKVCDNDGSRCKTNQESINVKPGAEVKLNKQIDTVLGNQYNPSLTYQSYCTLKYISGKSVECPQALIVTDNPLFYSLKVNTMGLTASSIESEQQLADVNHDKANNALDCAKMFSNYNTPGADANHDGKTDSLDVSLCHKWGFLKSK